MASISCEISPVVVITTVWRPSHTSTAWKISLKICACDPYDLYGAQALDSDTLFVEIGWKMTEDTIRWYAETSLLNLFIVISHRDSSKDTIQWSKQ